MKMSGKVQELPFLGWKTATPEMVDELTAMWVEYKFRETQQTPATHLDRNVLACVTLEDLRDPPPFWPTLIP